MSVTLNDIHSFYFMRHGATASNARKTMAGSEIDEPLSVEGIKGIETMRPCFQGLIPQPSVICHSGMKRALETAEIINTNKGLTLFKIPEFKERALGRWSGCPEDEIINRHDYLARPFDGESILDVSRRAKEGLLKVASLSQPALLVAHGGIWQGIAAIHGYLFLTWPKNGDIYHFTRTTSSFPWKVEQLTCGSRGIMGKKKIQTTSITLRP